MRPEHESVAAPRRGWDLAYAGAPPAWEIGRPQAAVVRIADSGGFSGRVLDAGCGTGENALELARRGLTTCGIDGSQRAIERARANARERGLEVTFTVGEALDLGALGQRFDSALDCGLFHTFGDEERERYVQTLAAAVVPGGIVHLLCFSDAEPWAGGPRRISRAEIQAAYLKGWSVISIDDERFETLLHPDGALAWHATIRRAPSE